MRTGITAGWDDFVPANSLTHGDCIRQFRQICLNWDKDTRGDYLAEHSRNFALMMPPMHTRGLPLAGSTVFRGSRSLEEMPLMHLK